MGKRGKQKSNLHSLEQQGEKWKKAHLYEKGQQYFYD